MVNIHYGDFSLDEYYIIYLQFDWFGSDRIGLDRSEQTLRLVVSVFIDHRHFVQFYSELKILMEFVLYDDKLFHINGIRLVENLIITYFSVNQSNAVLLQNN